MASIASFSGLASGIQWSDMVDQIMQLESARRLSPVTNRIKLQEQRKSAWGDYNGLVTKLRDASKLFKEGTAFESFKATATSSAVSGRALVSATASTGATPGVYDVEVLQLAQAEKIGSAEVTDAAAALGLSGTFHVNGRAVTLAGTDSLAAMRDKINAANSGSNASGVTATILSTSSTSHRLILSANNSGSRGIELIDSTSGVLQDPKLSILSGSQATNASTAESGWTDTIRFSARAEVLKDVLGVSPPPAVSTILVGGVQVEVDFNTDTLNDVLLKIQAADPNAKIREEQVNGRTMYRLSTSQSVAADPGSPESLRNLELLGFVKNGHGSQITAGLDAKFQIDGYSLSRRTNTVTDAIAGVTLDLLATDASARTSSISGTGLAIAKDPKTVNAGTYAINVTASTVKTATPSGATLSVASPVPSGAANGTHAVNITALATSASRTGTGFDGAYNQSSLLAPDQITITDGSGKAASVNLATGQDITTIVANLNNAFTANGLSMSAVNDGGQLKLAATTTAGSSSQFSVSSSSGSVQTNLGIANGTYIGTDIQGTIGGQAATGSGNTLTADPATTVGGLQVTYTGAGTGAVGSVTIADTTGVTGATIGGEAAVWDAATNTIRGAVGSRFEGLELTYSGTPTTGKVGDLTVSGDIGVEVRVDRDIDATVKKVEEFVDLYNKVSEFVKRQRDIKGPLASDASLRSMLGSLRDVILSEATGLSATNPYGRTALAGVEFTRTGTLQLKSDVLKSALTTNSADVRELFANVGDRMKAVADTFTDTVEGTIKRSQESLTSSISSLRQREINVEASLQRRREALTRQYTAMEEAMSRIQSQGNWMASQINALSPR